MAERARDVLFGSLLGALVGALPGLLAAGAFVTWRLGGDLREIDLLTYPRLVPALAGQGSGLIGDGALIGLGVFAAAVVGGVALAWRRELSSHGRAPLGQPAGDAPRRVARPPAHGPGPARADLGQAW